VPREGPVKFFIGHTQELSDRQTDDTLSWQSSDANNNNSIGGSGSSSPAAINGQLTNGVLPQDQKEPPRAKSSGSLSLNYLAKSQSQNQLQIPPQPDNQRRRRVSTMPDINIPPAPPLPPELLVPGTPLHLRKKRSVERSQDLLQDASNSRVSNEVAGRMTCPARNGQNSAAFQTFTPVKVDGRWRW